MYKIIVIIAVICLSSGLFTLSAKKCINKQLSSERENLTVQTDRDIYIAGENIMFKLFIYSNQPQTKTSNFAYLILRDTRNTYNKIYIKIENQNYFGQISLPDTLKTGYYEIVTFTNFLRNSGEQEFARKQILIVNRFDNDFKALLGSNANFENINEEVNQTPLPLKIALDKDSFTTREKINIRIIQNSKINYNNSISLTIKESIGYPELINKIKNKVEDSNNDSNKEYYLKEINGIILEGTVTNDKSDPVSSECIYMSTPDSIPNLQYSFTDEKGKFRFYLTDYYLEKPVIICLRDNKTNYRILLNDKFKLDEIYIPQYINLTRELKNYIAESQKLATLQKSFPANNTGTVFRKLYKPDHVSYLFTDPSFKISPVEFENFTNMQEMAENILPNLRIRNDNSDYFPYVINTNSRQYFNTPAAIFFNGIPIYNLNQLYGWNSSNFKNIDICSNLRIKGSISFNGIVSINSSKYVSPETLLPNSIKFDMGKFPDLKTYEPKLFSKNSSLSHIPDFRQLLYWNPTLSLDSTVTNIEFVSSDWTGKYLIELNGIDLNGEPFQITSEFKIYDQNN